MLTRTPEKRWQPCLSHVFPLGTGFMTSSYIKSVARTPVLNHKFECLLLCSLLVQLHQDQQVSEYPRNSCFFKEIWRRPLTGQDCFIIPCAGLFVALCVILFRITYFILQIPNRCCLKTIVDIATVFIMEICCTEN
jgi:hypothetical protein